MQRNRADLGRQLLPRPQAPGPTGPGGSPPGGEASSQRPKRSQVKLACERCRKRKAKCDGHRPACRSCLSARARCEYAGPSSTLKQRLVELEDAYAHVKKSYDAIRKSAEQGTTHLLDGPTHHGASHSSGGHHSLADGETNGPPKTTSAGESSRRPMVDGNPSSSILAWHPVDSGTAVPLLSRWTTVSNDDGLLNHLFRLFWTWDHALARILHRGLLLDSLTADPGPTARRSTDFCSEFLINAILAVSASSYHKSDDYGSSPIRGSAFAEEAFRLLGFHQERVQVSLMQGVALLSHHEMAFGDSQLGASLFFDKLSALQSSSGVLDGPSWLFHSHAGSMAQAVREAMISIANGFHCLDVKMSVIANRSSTSLGLSGVLPSQAEDISSLWMPYPLSTEPRLSYSVYALTAEYGLTRLANEFILGIEETFSSPVPDYRTSKRLYDRLLGWRSSTQDLFRAQTTLPPAWASLLIWFDLVCIKLLEPYMGLSFLEFDGGETSRSVSQSHCENLISYLWHYRTAFGMRLECWMVYACHAAVSTLLLNLPLPGPHEQALSRGCELLFEMGEYMPRAGELLLTLEEDARTKGVDVPAACKTFVEAGASRARRVHIRNVTPLVYSLTNEAVPLRTCSATFASQIERLEEED